MKTESAISERLKAVSANLDRLNKCNGAISITEIIAAQAVYNVLAWVLLDESDVDD